MPFTLQDRQRALDALAAQPPELLIIGGGAVGCSVAAHAARLGLRTVLVEKEDFSAGASGHSTGLAHAGLRYLAQGRVGYVFHESRERRRLQRLAPHLVKPFNFLYPVYKGDAFPLWMVKLGTWIYDRMAGIDALLAGATRPQPFRTVDAKGLAQRIPGLATSGLQGATEYFVDAQLPDQRFTLAFAQDAIAHGARVLTHTAVASCRLSSAGDYTVTLEDRLRSKVYSVTPRLILNCAGAWMDELRQSAGLAGQVLLRSRGTHVVIDRLAESPLIFSSPEKGRVFFVLPGPSRTSIVGTTDVVENDVPEHSHPERGEIQALLGLLKRFFPGREPKVRSLYWGVRPLCRQSKQSSDASREHRLLREKKNYWSLPGVKLTAARAAGEEAARAAHQTLRGKKADAIDLGLLPGGDRESRLKRWLDAHPDQRDLVHPDESWTVGEAAFSAAEEMAFTLNDFLWRRSKWPLYRDIDAMALDRMARVMGDVLGWTEDVLDRQKRDYHDMLAQHRVSPT